MTAHLRTSDSGAVTGAVTGATTIRVDRYSDVRGGLRDADVLLFRGKGLCSRVCAIGGGGIYSHAASVYWEKDRVRLIQATGKGVDVCFLSDELRDYNGAVELWRVTDQYGVPPFDARGAIAEGLKCVGATYAYSPLIRFFFDWLLRPIFKRNFRSRSQSMKSFFCSELVAHSYRVGGKLDLDIKHGDAATGPGDLPRGGRIRQLCAFAHDDVVDRLPDACQKSASCPTPAPPEVIAAVAASVDQSASGGSP